MVCIGRDSVAACNLINHGSITEVSGDNVASIGRPCDGLDRLSRIMVAKKFASSVDIDALHSRIHRKANYDTLAIWCPGNFLGPVIIHCWRDMTPISDDALSRITTPHVCCSVG